MAHAETAIYKFESPEQERVFHELITELRCPQCQNNNIAESNAGLSSDMRDKVYELVTEGQTKKEIVQFMVDRYGNFITYDPPVTSATIILWVAPAISLLIGIIYVVYRSRRSVLVETETQQESATEKANPQHTPEQPVATKAPTSYTFVAAAIVFVAVLTGSIIYKVTDWEQIAFEKQAVAALPELTQRYTNNQMRSMEEFQRLFVGLRSYLLKDPNNGEYWRLLGEIYETFLSKPSEALRAFEHAYQADPDNYLIQSSYAQLLLRNSPYKNDRIKAVELLRNVIQKEPDHFNSLYWLALYEQSEQNYAASISIWERMLSILPESSSTDIQNIRALLEKDKLAYEKQHSAQ